MPDNVTFPDAADVARTIATDEVTRGGAPEHQQIVKVGLGADGDYDCLVDSGQQAMALSVPVVIASDQSVLPVSGPVTNAELRAAAVPVSAATVPLPTGAATSALQPALINDRVPVVLTTSAGVAVEPAAVDDSLIYVSGTGLTVKYAIIDHATGGDNEIVALVAAKRIRVLSCFMVVAAAVVARFESNAGGTALTGQMNLGANGGFVLPHNPTGWFQTGAGESLSLELGAAVSVDGALSYVEV